MILLSQGLKLQRGQLNVCAIKNDAKLLFFPVLPDIQTIIAYFGVIGFQPCPPSKTSIKMEMNMEHCGMILTGKTEILREKYVSGLILPPQIVYCLVPPDPSRALEVKGQGMTAGDKRQNIFKSELLCVYTKTNFGTRREHSPFPIGKPTGCFMETTVVHRKNHKEVIIEWVKFKTFSAIPGDA